MEATTQEFPLELTKIQESKDILEVEEQSKIQGAEVHDIKDWQTNDGSRSWKKYKDRWAIKISRS